MVTPGKTAPVESVIVPPMDCALTAAAPASTEPSIVTLTKNLRLMTPPRIPVSDSKWTPCQTLNTDVTDPYSMSDIALSKSNGP